MLRGEKALNRIRLIFKAIIQKKISRNKTQTYILKKLTMNVGKLTQNEHLKHILMKLIDFKDKENNSSKSLGKKIKIFTKKRILGWNKNSHSKIQSKTTTKQYFQEI